MLEWQEAGMSKMGWNILENNCTNAKWIIWSLVVLLVHKGNVCYDTIIKSSHLTIKIKMQKTDCQNGFSSSWGLEMFWLELLSRSWKNCRNEMAYPKLSVC